MVTPGLFFQFSSSQVLLVRSLLIIEYLFRHSIITHSITFNSSARKRGVSGGGRGNDQRSREQDSR